MPVADGFVPTPPAVADYLAKTLFVDIPEPEDRILFPGAGTGCLAAAVERYCSVRGHPCPEAVAVDISPGRLDTLTDHVGSETPHVPPVSSRSKSRLRATYPPGTRPSDRPVSMSIETQVRDFLLDPPEGEFDYIVANPPYTRYNRISPEKRDQYREKFRSATGQFPLYIPFVEQMQRLLADNGTLVFLAPVGYMLSRHTAELRRELRRDRLGEFMLLPEAVFPEWKVETVVTTLSADTDIGQDGHFWIDSFIYPGVVNELLEHVGVHDPDRRDELTEQYYDEYDIVDRILSRKQRRKGQEGGYNVERFPPEYRPGESHQSDIGRW